MKGIFSSTPFCAYEIQVASFPSLIIRHYGNLQGLSKSEAPALMGKELVRSWRRSWDVSPPPLNINDKNDWRNHVDIGPYTIKRNPYQPHTVTLEKNVEMPLTESLRDCALRANVLWNTSILPELRNGQNVLIVAHANTIRGLIKLIDGAYMTIKDVQEVSIPSAVPLVYDFVYDTDSAAPPLPVAEPTKLGMRGRYLLSRELIRLSLHHDKDDEDQSDFYNFTDMSLADIIEYTTNGAGKDQSIRITNHLGKIIHVNDKWCQVTGYTREEALGKQWKFLHGPMTKRSSICDINAKVHSGLCFEDNIINYNRYGEPYLNHFKVVPVYDWLYRDKKNSTEEIVSVRHPRLNATYNGLNHIAPSHFVNKSERRVEMPELSPLPQELISKKTEILPVDREAAEGFEARELGTKAWL